MKAMEPYKGAEAGDEDAEAGEELLRPPLPMALEILEVDLPRTRSQM